MLEAEPVACVILEAASALAEPAPGYLEGVRALCDRHGTVLVFDETITGFRWAAGGAQAVYGVTPDLSTWGKAMGNGFSVAALAGRRELMELGGLRTDRPRAFLLSSTNGAETTGLAAFRAVVRAYTDPAGPDPVAAMERQGRALADGVNAAAAEAGIGEYLSVLGRPSCQIFRTADATGAPSQAMRTLFLQEILRRGVLGQSYVISAAHTDVDVEQTVEAARGRHARLPQGAGDRPARGAVPGRPVAPAHRLMAEPGGCARRLPAVPAARTPDDRRLGPAGQASSSISAVTADSVSGMPRSAARLSAMCSSRRIRPATASLVIGGSAS